MTHVSRHAPSRRVSDKTLDLFMSCVTAKWSASERKSFFHELITPTERIMLSKRLAIIYMLVKGYTFDDIQETLRVSPTTVAKFWSQIRRGKYAHVVGRIEGVAKDQVPSLQWLLDLMPPRHQTKKQYADRAKRLGL